MEGAAYSHQEEAPWLDPPRLRGTNPKTTAGYVVEAMACSYCAS
jgi:hypothetical protein